MGGAVEEMKGGFDAPLESFLHYEFEELDILGKKVEEGEEEEGEEGEGGEGEGGEAVQKFLKKREGVLARGRKTLLDCFSCFGGLHGVLFETAGLGFANANNEVIMYKYLIL